ncbi:peptidyl-prolyl cis-trans isomerase sig-7 [Drosophila busckii]|uniref:peptidyl-prolyl cis-trans isomerase sig-7 n=1 Tax=Drosophila busckii TaxID=30019 RepID=UPI001432CF0F|nr:peptidyl-prolyl cis-trans isomerase sig-7 [Drosophila busckii]
MSVVIETTLGDLTVDLFIDERPIACLNFLKLCQLKYYNFNLFHTVQQGFIAQTGDPSGAGDGGSSIWGVVEGSHKRFFEAEMLPKIHHSSAGMLSLVSAGKNLVGSQFFFTLGDSLTSLDGQHCVIGEVVEGHELLRKLNDAIVDENHRPYQDIRITHTVVLEDPFPNPRGFQVPNRSPSPSAERLKNGRIAADEAIDDANGKTMEEMQELLAEREAKARATILEIVGDLPDADMAPPENVLFICKLNPVTTDDDLEIIFSRFGVVKGCEVIRDRKSGDSLQYAFVEFEDQKSCEAAYFKMDNVLIDDRRIHVDFSQSVSKVTWRGKGRGVTGADGQLDFNNLRDNTSNRNGSKRYQRRELEPRSKDERGGRSNSAERRKARDQRHQKQKEREERESKSSRSREHNIRRRSTSRDKYERDRNIRRRSRSKDRHDSERERRNRRLSGSREQYVDRRRANSPYRGDGQKEYTVRIRQEMRHSNSSRDNIRRNLTNQDKSVQKERRLGELRPRMPEPKSVLKKKLKRDKGSSTESSDSSDDSESSTDSSSESSDSSSSDERHKRKKKRKSKHKNKSKAKNNYKSKKINT